MMMVMVAGCGTPMYIPPYHWEARNFLSEPCTHHNPYMMAGATRSGSAPGGPGGCAGRPVAGPRPEPPSKCTPPPYIPQVNFMGRFKIHH